MGELDKKSQKGLEYFKEKGSIADVKSSLDGMIDGMFDEDPKDPIEKSTKKGNRSNMNWVWMALAVLLLCLIGYIGFLDGSSTDKTMQDNSKVLFAQYFEPMDDITSDVSRGDAEIEADDLGMKLYNQGKYLEASTILLAREDKVSQVYGSFALLNAGNANDAIALMENQLRSMDYKEYHDILRWNHAMAILKSGDKEKAKKQFQYIINTKGYKSKEAINILKEL